jgi:hypothetical protein
MAARHRIISSGRVPRAAEGQRDQPQTWTGRTRHPALVWIRRCTT